MSVRWTGLLVTLLILATLLASAGCVRPAVRTVPTGPHILTSITWNTHGGRGNLHRITEDLDRGALEPGGGGATLLMLQEVTATEVEAIAAPRHWSSAFVQVRGDDTELRGNAIVSSVPLRNQRILPLPRERQPRAAVVASLDLAGQELFVMSVHLENRAGWWKGGLLGDTARHHQVAGLLRAIPGDKPGIVGGDFNTWLGPQEAAWLALTARFADAGTWPRTPTFRDRLVLDHLLMDLPDGWRGTTRVLADDYGSDHRPVLGAVFGL